MRHFQLKTCFAPAVIIAGCLVISRFSEAAELTGRVELNDGRPVLTADGKKITTSYCDTFPWMERMHIRNRQFAKLKVQLFHLALRGGYDDEFFTTPFWRDDGVYGDESDFPHYATLDRQATEILAENPDAVFLFRWYATPPVAWTRKHTDQMQRADDGRQMRDASYASESNLAGQERFIEEFVRYIKRHPWGGRVIGYVAIPNTEGITELSLHGYMFDQSPAMLAAFREFLKTKYGRDEALQKAWNDPKVTLPAAPLPTDSGWRAERAKWMHWPKPDQTVRYRDYFELQRDLLHRYVARITTAIKKSAGHEVIAAIDALKQPMSGWLIRDAFEAEGRGMDFPNMLVASGSFGVGRTLDLESLNVLMTPADYSARSVGFGFEPEGIADSLVLRGKTILVEDDARSWTTNERVTQGAWRNKEEARAGLARNFAVCASRGFFPYWMNIGRGFFDDPAVMKLVAEQIPLRDKVLGGALAPTEHAIAMILDDESPLEEDFTSGFQNLAVLRQRNDELALTGLPYRIYLWSDLARDDFPRFRAYLLPNLFRLTPDRAELVRKKLMRDGSVVIFGPGTGITDGARLGSESVSALLGIPLELNEKQCARRVLIHAGSHPAVAHVPGPLVYGESYVYGPILQPAHDLSKTETVELGKASVHFMANTAGLVLRNWGRGAVAHGKPGPRGEGDCAVVFSMATPLPAALLRSLAIYGGCNAWSDLGDVVAANADFLAVHSVRPGRRTIHLPAERRVRDGWTSEVIAERAASFTADLASPDTRIFLLETP